MNKLPSVAQVNLRGGGARAAGLSMDSAMNASGQGSDSATNAAGPGSEADDELKTQCPWAFEKPPNNYYAQIPEISALDIQGVSGPLCCLSCVFPLTLVYAVDVDTFRATEVCCCYINNAGLSKWYLRDFTAERPNTFRAYDSDKKQRKKKMVLYRNASCCCTNPFSEGCFGGGEAGDYNCCRGICETCSGFCAAGCCCLRFESCGNSCLWGCTVPCMSECILDEKNWWNRAVGACGLLLCCPCMILLSTSNQ